MKKIAIATRNEHKLREYQSMLEHLKFEVFSLVDFPIKDIEETGETFFENARIKAKALRKHTNIMVLADDSGLEVDALGGRPGIHSKRFSDEGTDDANNQKLLDLMSNQFDRTARFVTAVCVIDESGNTKRFEGELHGYIHTACEGEHGFGYDPLFIPVGYNKTLAELGDDVKNRISHRARCLHKVLDYLDSL
jgi:XTP/dITP diphosphohydrolase